MNTTSTEELRHELRLAGATREEIRALIPIATQLQALPKTIKRHHTSVFRWPILAASSLVSLAIIVFAMLLAMPAITPGNPFAAMQHGADNIAIAVHPNYRDTVMMKQADQINALVASHAATKTVLASLADYRTTVGAYTGRSPHYGTVEYCRAELRKAANRASEPERNIITASLQNIQSV
jgi:hypothetical protein